MHLFVLFFEFLIEEVLAVNTVSTIIITGALVRTQIQN